MASRSPETCASRRSGAATNGWIEAQEAEGEEPPESKPEVIRSLVTPLADGSFLLVGDERRRSDDDLERRARGLRLGASRPRSRSGRSGGLWLSAQFLGRIDSMRQTARRLMDRRLEPADSAEPHRRRSDRPSAHFQPTVRSDREAHAGEQAGQRRHRARSAQALGGRAASSRSRTRRLCRPARRAPRSATRSATSRECSRPSTPCCASARSRLARGGRRSGRSTSLKSRARSPRRSRRPPKTKARRSFSVSTRRFRSPATRNFSCR